MGIVNRMLNSMPDRQENRVEVITLKRHQIGLRKELRREVINLFSVKVNLEERIPVFRPSCKLELFFLIHSRLMLAGALEAQYGSVAARCKPLVR